MLISIFWQRKKRSVQTETLHQILAGLSICDILASLTLGTVTLMLPADLFDDVPWAIGNEASCTASASLYVLFATAANGYNGWLSLHFWRSVRNTPRTFNLASLLEPERSSRSMVRPFGVYSPVADNGACWSRHGHFPSRILSKILLLYRGAHLLRKRPSARMPRRIVGILVESYSHWIDWHHGINK